MCRELILYAKPIRFFRFGKLLLLELARDLDPWHRPKGSWTLGTRMQVDQGQVFFSFSQNVSFKKGRNCAYCFSVLPGKLFVELNSFF